MAPAVHRYTVQLRWAGSTGAGYAVYDRNHEVTAPPAGAALAMSADPSFRGDADRLNPEQLLVAAASSCHLLSFLAVCARAGLDVLAYDDAAEGTMPQDEEPVRMTAIVLRPTVTVAAGTDPDLVHRLVDVAHQECYVANSLRTAVTVAPTVLVRP